MESGILSWLCTGTHTHTTGFQRGAELAKLPETMRLCQVKQGSQDEAEILVALLEIFSLHY